MTAADRERLAAYLDGELAPLERAAVERELEASEEARQVLAELAALDAVARSLPVEAPEGYFETLPGRVRSRLAEREPRRRAVPTWAWAAAAALAVAAIAPLTLRQLGDAPPPAAARPQGTDLDRAMPLPEATPPPAAPEAQSTEDAGADAPAAPATLEEAVLSEPSRGRALRSQSAPPAAAAAAAPPPARQPLEREVTTGPSASNESPVPADAAPEGFAVAPREPGRGDDRREAAATPAPRPEALADAEEHAAGRLGAAQESDEARAGVSVAGGAAAKRGESSLAVGADAERFTGLAARRPRSAEEARLLREDWRGFVLLYPASPLADEARVRTVEAGLEAFRLGEAEADRRIARRDAEAYLEREDAAQPGRVRALLSALDR